MATLYEDEQKRLEEERKKLQQQQTEAAAGQYGQAAIDAGKTTYNYTPSDALIAARQYLDTQAQQKPAQYNSRYTDQLSGILSQIQGRKPFQYDAAADPLYNIYKDLYIQNGRRAMQDTMGQAAALTGGYGNSYGQFAGQQQYGQHMENLNAMIPQLQQQAYQQYQGEGDRLAQLYQLVNGAESMDYAKYRDLVGDWQAQQQLAQQMALQYAQLAYQYEQANKKSGGEYKPKKKEPENFSFLTYLQDKIDSRKLSAQSLAGILDKIGKWAMSNKNVQADNFKKKKSDLEQILEDAAKLK